MKFLVDEGVPVVLLKELVRLGHDAVRVKPASSDAKVAKRATQEKRTLITLDKDFTNTLMYPPSQLNVIHIRIHPPLAERIVDSVKKLLGSLSREDWKGLIVLEEAGHIRIC